MKKIRKGDEIAVLAGRDKGKRGAVLRVLDDDRVMVEGVHLVKRHTNVAIRKHQGLDTGDRINFTP